MTREKLKKVKEEMRRMQDALRAYDAAYDRGEIYYASKYRSAIRRASMDLTRALAELRK